MSELIQKNDNRAAIRWKLLTGASALALAAYISSAATAKAEDAAKPPIWLELDGQFAMQKNDLEIYAPPFLAGSPFDAGSHLGYEKAGPNVWNNGASLTFQPEGSDWMLSASVRYGKSSRHKRLNEIPTQGVPISGFYQYQGYQDFRTSASEANTILDFKVGRDVGLGKFGSNASSVLNLGIRFAQFHSQNHVGLSSQPTNCNTYCPYNKFHASFEGLRKFTGIGPALSWDASSMIAGNSHDGGISLDWGVNGALLFGRQKMSARHETSDRYFNYYYERIFSSPIYDRAPPPVSRSKRVTVTNLGGFAGVSWRYAAAKITMGYRADYFFGVLDGGIDTAKKEDRAFYGPFLSIAVGIGD